MPFMHVVCIECLLCAGIFFRLRIQAQTRQIVSVPKDSHIGAFGDPLGRGKGRRNDGNQGFG